ncbi:SRPBCC family protein [Streptomyces sp. WZ-12]|uniref:SRPBCC family protein n=1 Tax=Streptomyces sp. WZ-12 TaxID=3030210 RepID=UPI00238174B4|nr:SRPBCC family protein [Streptomyces sp. WZ-12]
MSRRLRPVALGFAASAPLRLTFSTEVAAPPGAVYAALADDVPGLPEWFAAVSRAEPTPDGRGREITLTGGVRFAETLLATEPAARYAYRIDTTNAPVVRALLEDWRLTPAGAGTRVRWTFAADGPAAFRWLMPLARPALGRAFRVALRALDRRLAAG